MPMRILIVSEDIPYPNMGGLAKHALNLARALVKAGHEVDLLGNNENPIEAAGEEGRFGGHFFGELSGYYAGWKELGLGMFAPPRRPWLARHFARIIMRHAPAYDVIHYHGHVPNVARHIPVSVNFVQTRHDQGSDCLKSTRFRRGEICITPDPAECAGCIAHKPNALQRAVSAAAVSRFRREVAESFRRHKTIFVSNLLHRNFARTMGPGPWGVTVHNFVDVARLERARQSAEPASPAHGTSVFVAAKLYPSKGVEPFLRELAARRCGHIHVTLAGDGPDEGRLRAEFESDRVRFLGWCDPDKTLRMAAGTHAIVVPSVWEDPCPSTIFEGLLLGKPTFALARGGAPELAVYASSPQQLRLHPDMRSLVTDLVSFDPGTRFELPAQWPGSSDRAAEILLQIYRLPPGPLPQTDR